jgi:hypothetical protein
MNRKVGKSAHNARICVVSVLLRFVVRYLNLDHPTAFEKG